MHTTLRRMTASLGALLLITLAACGATAVPSASPTPSPPSSAPAAASPSADPEARDAYGAAICPLFDRIALLDPRLAAIRQVGADGDEIEPHAAEIGEVEAELGSIVNELDAVPDWEPGRRLQFELIGSLHAIRAQLLSAERDLGAVGVADVMAALPYIATPTMDRAMARAAAGGLVCGAPS